MAELDELRKACLDALEVIRGQSVSDPQIEPLTAQLRTVVEHQYVRKSRSGLKGIVSEIRKWAREINAETADRVEECLQLLAEPNGRFDANAVDSIVARRRIRNKNEYELVLDRVEQVHTDPAQREKVQILNKLLADYIRRREN